MVTSHRRGLSGAPTSTVIPSLSDVRPALAFTFFGIGLAAVIAFSPSINPLVQPLPESWGSLVLGIALCGVLIAIALSALVACIQALPWPRTSRLPRWTPPWDVVAARSNKSVGVLAGDAEEADKPASATPNALDMSGASSASSAAGGLYTEALAPLVPYVRTRPIPPPPRFVISGAGLAALLLGLLVLVEGAGHVGGGSGGWATGRPASESDKSTADGYVAWVEGRPVQAETLYTWDQVSALSQRTADSGARFQDPASIASSRTGHAAYAFLVTLVTRLTSLLGSAFAAYLVVNLLCWWIGALAIFDLARRATGSWWTGLLAGALAGTGLGFTWMVGLPYSAVASYAGVAVVLWLIERLRPFDAGTPIRDLVLTGTIAAATGLLYGLLIFMAGAIVAAFVGRTDLRRLVLWCALVLGIGQVWSQVLSSRRRRPCWRCVDVRRPARLRTACGAPGGHWGAVPFRAPPASLVGRARCRRSTPRACGCRQRAYLASHRHALTQ